MSADYTTLGLLANLKRRGFTPAGSGLTTNDLLDVLSETLRGYIPAFLKGLREEYIVAQLSITVTAPAVPIPARACGAALRTIGWLCSDGSVRPLTRIEPERRQDWAQSGGEPQGFVFQGNNAILVPAASSGTVVVSYQQRPGQLVLPSDAALITAYDDPATLTVSGLPSNFVNGTVVDIVKGTPNFELSVLDGVLAAVTDSGGGLHSLTIVAYPDALPTGLVGGYVCLAGETAIPQLPTECFDLLAQAAAFQIASDTGSERLEALRISLEGKDGKGGVRAAVAQILAPRDDGGARIIVNRSGIGRRRF